MVKYFFYPFFYVYLFYYLTKKNINYEMVKKFCGW